MSKVIAIDYGHTLTGKDTGAAGCGKKEQDCTREVGKIVTSKLKALGYTVVECACDSCNSLGESLSHRTTTANNAKADFYVSLHLNACPGGQGTEVWTYGAKQLAEAKSVLANIVALGYKNRGIKDGSSLYVLKHTNMPAMLVELCFIDSESDMQKYNATKFADAIVKGIAGKTVTTSTSTTTTTKTQSSSTSKSNTWIASLQQACNACGYSRQVVDGIAGPATLAGCPLLKYGSSGTVVKLLQEKLNSLGYNCGAADGIFGRATRSAVAKYQSSKCLAADGIVGKCTWKSLLGL